MKSKFSQFFVKRYIVGAKPTYGGATPPRSSTVIIPITIYIMRWSLSARLYTGRAKEARILLNFQELDCYDIILRSRYPCSCSQIWKVFLHYLQNWQNYSAFSRWQLSTWDAIKIVSTIQDGTNTVSVNTFLSKEAQNVFHLPSRNLDKLFYNSG